MKTIKGSVLSVLRQNIPLYLVFIVLLILAGCSRQQQKHQRIVVLTPNYTEILYALGVGDDIVGWTMYCNYPPEVQKVPGWVRYDKYEYHGIQAELKKPRAVVSDFTGVNYALIDSLHPSLILSAHEMLAAAANQLRKKGYNVLHYEPATIEDEFRMMEEIGDSTGTGNKARELTAEYRKEIRQIKSITDTLPRLKVYFEINHMGPWILGKKSPMNEIIRDAGGENIFADVDSEAFEGSWDEVVKRNPDVILSPMWEVAGDWEVTTIREIMTRKDAEKINAVKWSRVYFYDSALFKHPGPRQVTAIRKLAHLLHPYYFKNPKDSVDPWELGKIDEAYPPPPPLY